MDSDLTDGSEGERKIICEPDLPACRLEPFSKVQRGGGYDTDSSGSLVHLYRKKIRPHRKYRAQKGGKKQQNVRTLRKKDSQKGGSKRKGIQKKQKGSGKKIVKKLTQKGKKKSK